MKKFTFRDVLFFLGFIIFGYGLYLIKPCISFSVCGALILIAALFMRDE